jgi:hypothetical protein
MKIIKFLFSVEISKRVWFLIKFNILELQKRKNDNEIPGTLVQTALKVITQKIRFFFKK